MTSKTRLDKIQQKIKPAGIFTVIYEDPGQEGSFYDKAFFCHDRKQLLTEEVQRLHDSPGTLFIVNYVDKPKLNPD